MRRKERREGEKERGDRERERWGERERKKKERERGEGGRGGVYSCQFDENNHFLHMFLICVTRSISNILNWLTVLLAN